MDMGHALSQLNYLAVLVAAVSNFILGALWYSPPLFGKTWMAAAGMTEEDVGKANMPLILGLAFLLELLAAGFVGMLLHGEGTLHLGLIFGLHVGAFAVATSFGVVYLFEQRPFKLWLVNAGYMVVAFTLMGGIIGVWP